MPVLRTQQQTPLSRLTGRSTQEPSVFKPIEQQQSSIISDTTPRPTPIHPQTNHYPATEKLNFVNFKILKNFFGILFVFSYTASVNSSILRYTNTTIRPYYLTYGITNDQSNSY